MLRLFLVLRASIFAAFMQVWDSAGVVSKEMGVPSGLLHSAGDSPFCLKPCVSAPTITNKVSLILYTAVHVFAA